MAAVPVRSLKWVRFPNDQQPGSLVTLHDPDAWGSGVYREGRVTRMIGALDAQTRLARVLITVDDPLGEMSQVPPLILGTLIEAKIDGVPIEDVVRLEREHVHDGDTVWVMNGDELEIRKSEVVFRDPTYAYVRTGLESGDQVVTTTLATVANGVKLRKVERSAKDDVQVPDSEATASTANLEQGLPVVEIGELRHVKLDALPASNDSSTVTSSQPVEVTE